MSLVRTLFFVLLTANLLFLVVGRSMFGGVPVGEPGRLAAQIEPQKVRIVTSGEPAAGPSAAPEGGAAPAVGGPVASPAAQASPAAPSGDKAAAPGSAADAAAPAAERCVVVAGLSGEQVAALRAKLQGGDGVKMDDRALDGASWWVNIPPLVDREAAVRRAEEVRGQGVGGAFIIREDGEHRNAVSLGLFKSEASAQEFMRQLAAKGVKGARITVRSVPGSRHNLTMRGPADRVGELAELALAANTGARREECAAR